MIAIVSIALAAALHELIALVIRLITRNGKKKQPKKSEEAVQATAEKKVDSNIVPEAKEATV